MDDIKIVVGLGEVLWDIFPNGKKMGGAPTNFAFGCSQFGAKAIPVSSIGNDSLGDEIFQIIQNYNLDTSFIQRKSDVPTGTVNVELDSDGKPKYVICENVAWDNIEFSQELEELAKKTDACCFGSLAQRNEVSRQTIYKFLESMPEKSLKIFDINIRQHFYSKEIIENSLKLSNVLKLSDEELVVLQEMFDLKDGVIEQLKSLRTIFNLDMIIYTRGSKGSILISEDEINEHCGCEGKAINSVGAGDSFTATFCMDYLNKKTLAQINDHANKVATFVCMQETATPIFPENLL